MRFEYDQQIPGNNSLVAQYNLKPTAINEPEFKQKIRVKLNKNGLVELTEYAIEETFYEEVKEVKKEEKKEDKKEEKKKMIKRKKLVMKKRWKRKRLKRKKMTRKKNQKNQK